MPTLIVNFKNVQEVTDCDLLFLDASKSREFDALLEKTKDKSTLIVTNRAGLGAKGSCINFRVVDGKLRFEINQKASEAANLKHATALMSLAILI